MKSLKYAIVSAILALGIAAPVVSAQEDGAAKAKHSQGGKHGDMTAQMLRGITLTADQQKQVDAIKADAQKQMSALAPEDMRTKGAAIRKDVVTKIRAVLTDEQKATFDANTKSARGGKGGGDSSKGAPGKGDKGGKGKKPKASEGGDE